MSEKLFKLFFPNKYESVMYLQGHARRLAQAVQRKGAEIQTLKRKIRRMEREKK